MGEIDKIMELKNRAANENERREIEAALEVLSDTVHVMIAGTQEYILEGTRTPASMLDAKGVPKSIEKDEALKDQSKG